MNETALAFTSPKKTRLIGWRAFLRFA